MFKFTLWPTSNEKVNFFRFSRTVKIFLFFALFVTFVHLGLSLFGTEDWSGCEEEASDLIRKKICEDFMRNVNCKKLERPVKGQIVMEDKMGKKTVGEVLCGWENAMTEIRICFDFGCLLAVGTAIAALCKKSRYLAELSLNGSYFFVLLLTVVSLFDYLAVQESKTANFLLCTLDEELDSNGITTKNLIFSYTLFNFTVFWGFFTSLCLVFTSYLIRAWIKIESIEKLRE